MRFKVGDEITWRPGSHRSAEPKAGEVLAVIQAGDYAFPEHLISKYPTANIGRFVGLGTASTMDRYLVAVLRVIRSRNGARTKIDFHTPRVEYLDAEGKLASEDQSHVAGASEGEEA